MGDCDEVVHLGKKPIITEEDDSIELVRYNPVAHKRMTMVNLWSALVAIHIFADGNPLPNIGSKFLVLRKPSPKINHLPQDPHSQTKWDSTPHGPRVIPSLILYV